MTIISFKKRFIFLANMKCGSTTLHKLLAPYADIISCQSIFQKPVGKHDNAREVKHFIESLGYQWDDFYVFTTIREPFSRIQSCYNYEIKCGYLNPQVSFENFIQKGQYYEHFRDLDYFIKPGINYIIRMEDFNEELPTLWIRLKLGEFKDQIPKLNTSKSTSELTSEKKKYLIKLLKKRHESDYNYYP